MVEKKIGVRKRSYGALLLVPYTRAYSFILRMYTFLPLARLFFVWRDFFCLARLFSVWRDFFFVWRDFFCLVRLFLFGATFFCLARLFFLWRDFFCLARLFLIWRDFFLWPNFFRWVLSVRLLKCIIIQI